MSAGDIELLLRDLKASGLAPEDILARPIGNAERAATVAPASVEGYVIPYFNIYGKIQHFYRVRLFDYDPKYKQPKDSPNHVYFPPAFKKAVQDKNYVLITEGEKKAAAACKAGIPAVAFGGVDSWRNRIISIPKEAALVATPQGGVKAKINGQQPKEDYDAPIANGFQDLLDLALQRDLHLIIVYDSDRDIGVKADVQRAAATLGYELRFRGVPFNRIRQIILPQISSFEYKSDKVGLDDFLVWKDIDELEKIINDVIISRTAFPRHPSVRDYINKRLQNPRLSRKEIQNVSLAILSDLDARGIRLRASNDVTYYFDHKTKKLFRATFATGPSEAEFDAPFSQFLYQRYGLSAADSRILVWLGTQFSSEEPVEQVSPYKIFARPNANEDSVTLQVSDSQFVKVDKDGLHLFDNGTNNILFESDQVEAVNVNKLLESFEELQKKPVTNWWADVLADVRLKDQERQRMITSLLYYISPFLYRWRGTQLPIELVLGEAGSGKSTLCELRLIIQTGRPFLRNAPHDLKDWHASVTSSGGLHVTDNVQLVDKSLRQRLSDEICRIVTEPTPFVEQRKYYTNADLIRLPVRIVFAVTAIQQPFQNTDLLQRAMILELDKSKSGPNITYNSEWKNQQLNRFGGREVWLAHQLVVLQRFFQLVATRWKTNYPAKHRLINLEQSLVLMAEVVGVPSQWIPDYLNATTERIISENDWTLEGIIAYSKSITQPGYITTAKEISEWATVQEEFEQCEMLTNARRLGRYLAQHKALVLTSAGIRESGVRANRMTYLVSKK